MERNDNMRNAMIFAAGLGTRLRPYTDDRSKAMVEVDGRPMIEHQLLRLRAAGFTRVVINVHHYAQQIIDYVTANDGFGLDIAFSDETGHLLDTGGGIRKALPLFDADSPVLVHNVDIFSNADLAALYAAHLDEELVEKAVDFYVGYLSSNDNKEYLPNIVLSTLKGIVAESENKQGRVLFKLAVEMALMMNILAINLDIDQVSLERLRGECVKEVKRLNGSFGFEDALDWQKGTEWRG